MKMMLYVGPSTRILNEEVGPSNPTQQEEIKEHTTSDDETIAQIMLNFDRPRGIHISEPAHKSLNLLLNLKL